MEKRSIPEISFEAKLLIEVLLETEADETCTYHKLSDRLGQLINGSSSVLRTALNRVLRDYGIDFLVVRGVGLKRVSADTAANCRINQFREGTARQLRRRSRHLDLLPEDQMSKEVKLRKQAFQSQSQTLMMFLKPKQTKEIESKTIESGQSLSVSNVIELFKKTG